MTYKEYCESELGYKTITSYFNDFSIAERFGIPAIKDTYKRALLNTDYRYLTELAIVLNHKIWYTYKTMPAIAKCYDALWRELCDKLYEELKGDELQYFLEMTD